MPRLNSQEKDQVFVAAISIERMVVRAAWTWHARYINVPLLPTTVPTFIEEEVEAIGTEEFEVDRQAPEQAIIDAIARIHEAGTPECIAVAAYGPFETLDPRKRDMDCNRRYGIVRTSAHWGTHAGLDLYGLIHEKSASKKTAIVIETDAAAAALGEYIVRVETGEMPSIQSWDSHCLAYLFFTEGVGGGYANNGRIWRGALHPEMGQVQVSRHPKDAFGGVCHHHGGKCIEGLASRMAIAGRCRELGMTPEQLRLDGENPVWTYVADYIAQLCLMTTLILAPQRIVLGELSFTPEDFLGRVIDAFKEKLYGETGEPYFTYEAISSAEHPFISTSSIKAPELFGALNLSLQQSYSAYVKRLT